MGTTSDEEGETSSQTSHSDERPLKKARYIWQIKGKYHLKSPGDDEKDKLNLTESVADNDQNTSTDNVVEVTSETDREEENPSPSLNNLSIDSSITNEPENESLYPSYEMYRLSNTISNLELTKWQDRQVARSFVDNTINGVLEVMGFTPLPFEAEDVSDDDDIPAHSGDYELEDEAVRMAIHSHGLQRSEGNCHNSKRKSCCNDNETLLPLCSCRQSTSTQSNETNNHLLDPFHKRAIHFTPMELDLLKEDNNIISPSLVASRAGVSISIANVNSSFEKPEVALDSKLYTTQIIPECSDLLQEVNIYNSLSKQNSPSFDQNDFLDQAVAVAILKKGLSTLSGPELR